jgi:uncharacterized membrane protein
VNEQTSGFRETRLRSFTKTITWRSCAVTNSYFVLLVSTSSQPLVNALAMNVTGFLLFYFFERIWNLVHWGKIPLGASGSGTAANTS